MLGVLGIAAGCLMLVMCRVAKRAGEPVWQGAFFTLAILNLIAGFAYLIL